ncbi:MAG: hypothetical protein CMO01_27945 [Thalassobius sp.]|nr:hypothetical protein [Thalassovita sp.]
MQLIFTCLIAIGSLYIQDYLAIDFTKKQDEPIVQGEELKQAAFEVLNNKCNVCHRKQNPFMVFSLKNMEKRAAKINMQVFIKQRMPKGDEIKLTEKEYSTLKEWLSTQNLK